MTEIPLTGASNVGGVCRNHNSEPIYGFSACCERCNKPGVVNRVAGGARHRTASCDTSLVVSGGFFAREDDESVYDKKPQRYAKDHRTAHLTARSDKFVAYVTNNKRLYSTFCTVEANYDRHEALRGLFATAELLVR